MLSNKVIDHCQEQGWWHEDVPATYEEALQKLEIDLQSDFAQFYLHAEDGPTFYSRHQEFVSDLLVYGEHRIYGRHECSTAYTGTSRGVYSTGQF